LALDGDEWQVSLYRCFASWKDSPVFI